MRTFKDTAGRVWTIAVNVNSIKRVRDLANVDLLKDLGGNLVERLSGDPIVVYEILYALVKPEAETRSISAEDFGAALDGDVIEAASAAMLEDLIDFFPPGRRSAIRKAMAKMREVEAAAMGLAERKIDAIDAAAIAGTSTSGKESTNSPALSASTPAP